MIWEQCDKGKALTDIHLFKLPSMTYDGSKYFLYSGMNRDGWQKGPKKKYSKKR